MSIKDKYVVKPIDRYETKEWILKKHYAKRMPNVIYAFGLFDGEMMVGVCTFGQPPCDQIQYCCGENYEKHTIELNRLIKNDGLEKNVQSFFVAQCFKLLPKPMIIFSYSDPNYNHHGYTYQALNFFFTGQGGETREYIFQGQRFNSRHIKDYWFKARNLPFDEKKTIDQNFREIGGEVTEVEPKNRYVYFIGDKKQKKDMIKNFKYKVLPYPKGQNRNYDASYKTHTQLKMF